MQNNENTQKKENKWLADRSAGLFILILSCGAAVITIIWPLTEMLKHSENVSYSTNTIALTVLGILFGLAYLILGQENLDKLIGSSDTKGVARVIIFAVIFFAILFGFMLAWDSVVNTLGY
jgi:hypothetical protein